MLPARPLTGEPLALDLINTVWVEGRMQLDLLDSDEGARAWLKEHALSCDEALLTAVRDHLIFVRTALRGVLEAPHEPEHRDALNGVLARGHVRHFLGEHGPEEDFEVDPAWRPAWLAANDLLTLLRTSPQRLKKCANPQCVLHFLDTSPKNARRWHDMRTCGNRAKALRHYHRARD
ncbi:hypothetical protein Dcar01_03832 [Deinococcus carri]|uniref:Zinc finger CGNR domain-containing protein n=1 Tax=Deinococcus carri TaxID=1211323 RepID=A0ABP9WCL8_9DEIO